MPRCRPFIRLGSPIRRVALLGVTLLCLYMAISMLLHPTDNEAARKRAERLIPLSQLEKLDLSPKVPQPNDSSAAAVVEGAAPEWRMEELALTERLLLTSESATDPQQQQQQQQNVHTPSLDNTLLLPLCPKLKDNRNLTGHVGQGTLLIEDLEEQEVEQNWAGELRPGGSWRPQHCRPRYKVAIIIPYRDRQSHLNRLLDFLVPILQRQLLDFRFIVTEQKGDNLFNKGRIMNAAFQFARSLGVQCVVFHDVDMFPQDDRTPYDCPPAPRHVGAFVSNLGYSLWYKEIVGGALAIRVEHYLQVNGFSNSYWAWGGEDDDMGKRILTNNFTIERPNSEYVRFSMLKHVKRKRISPKLVYTLLESSDTRWVRDGVNETDKWRVVGTEIKPLYYHLLVDVGDPPTVWKDDTNQQKAG